MWAVGATGASAAQPPVAIPVADRIIAQRTLFGGCAEGRAAIELLALRSDADAIRIIDDAFEHCTRTAHDQDGVAAAELGIAVTAFVAARRGDGPAAAAEYDRAAGYARRAAIRSALAHRNDLVVVARPAGRASSSGVPTHVETLSTADGPARAEVASPIGSQPGIAYAPPTVLSEADPAPGKPIVKLARELESAARLARDTISAPK
jgi:hypothetical protein